MLYQKSVRRRLWRENTGDSIVCNTRNVANLDVMKRRVAWNKEPVRVEGVLTYHQDHLLVVCASCWSTRERISTNVEQVVKRCVPYCFALEFEVEVKLAGATVVGRRI